MKSWSRVLFVGALCILLEGCGSLSKNNRTKYFGDKPEEKLEEFFATIEKGAVFSKEGYQRFGTTWEDEKKRVRREFKKLNSREEIYHFLISLNQAYRDGHSRLIGIDKFKPARKKLILPVEFGVRKGKDSSPVIIVTKSENKAVNVGDQLKSYNGQILEDLKVEYRSWFDGHSPERFVFDWAEWLWKRDNRLHPLPKNKSVALELKTSSGKISKVSLDWKESPSKRKVNKDFCARGRRSYSDEYKDLKLVSKALGFCAYTDKPNKVLVVRYFSFYYWFSFDELKNMGSAINYKMPKIDLYGELHQQLVNADVKHFVSLLRKYRGYRVLLDLRENGGGTVPTGLLAVIAKKPFQISTKEFVITDLMLSDKDYFENSMGFASNSNREMIRNLAKNKGAVPTRRLPFFCMSKDCLLKEAKYKHRKDIPKPRYAVLTGPFCASSCDQVVAIFKDNDMGKLLGLPSEGSTSPFRGEASFRFANGGGFRMTLTTGIGYRANGEKLEGNPAKVDHYFWPTGNDVQKSIGLLSRK